MPHRLSCSSDGTPHVSGSPSKWPYGLTTRAPKPMVAASLQTILSVPAPRHRRSPPFMPSLLYLEAMTASGSAIRNPESGIYGLQDWAYNLVNINSKAFSEVHLLPASAAALPSSASLRCVSPRQPGHQYFVGVRPITLGHPTCSARDPVASAQQGSAPLAFAWRPPECLSPRGGPWCCRAQPWPPRDPLKPRRPGLPARDDAPGLSSRRRSLLLGASPGLR